MHLDPLYTQRGVQVESHSKNMGPTSFFKVPQSMISLWCEGQRSLGYNP
jgi:hypothetical protein